MTSSTENIIFELKEYKNELQNLMKEFTRFARFDLVKSEEDKKKTKEYQEKIVRTENKISILRQMLFRGFPE